MHKESLLKRQIPLKQWINNLFTWLSVEVHPPKITYNIRLGAAFQLISLLLVTRTHSIAPGAMFDSEDGLFFQEAYNFGIQSLLIPYAGYLHIFPRFIAWCTTFFHPAYAPSILSFVALGFQASVATYLLSDRLNRAFGNHRLLQWFTAIIVVLWPNALNTHNVAHMQWYAAILCLAILLAVPTKNKWISFGENIVLILFCLSSIFALFISAMACAVKSSKSLMPVFLSIIAGFQFSYILDSPRIETPGKHNISAIIHMISTQVGMGLRGQHTLPNYSYFIDWAEVIYACLVLGILVWMLLKGPLFFKWFIPLGILVFLAALRSGNTWYGLATPGQGERYFMFLGIAYAGALFYAFFSNKKRFVRYDFAIIGTVFFGTILWGMAHNWTHGQYGFTESYYKALANYDKAESGEHVIIPQSPMGWQVELIKKP